MIYSSAGDYHYISTIITLYERPQNKSRTDIELDGFSTDFTENVYNWVLD